MDDIPFGIGKGMLLRPEPIYEAYKSLNIPETNKIVLYFSPKGRILEQKYINSLTKYENIVLICGHYEGIDQRIIDLLVDEEISLGDFVLTSGEIPAMALIDAVARQIDGVIKESSLKEESFSNNLLEYRQWTRPREFMGMRVPDVLISGNHKEIEKFKLEDSIRETLKYRKDLILKNDFDENIKNIINKILKELENESNK